MRPGELRHVASPATKPVCLPWQPVPAQRLHKNRRAQTPPGVIRRSGVPATAHYGRRETVARSSREGAPCAWLAYLVAGTSTSSWLVTPSNNSMAARILLVLEVTEQ